jgi:serine/threonine protein kinase
VIGTRLDKYELLEKIGEGGMATVYRASHATLQREVAVKVLHPHLSSAIKNRKRFAREARTIEALHHDSILRIYDYSGEEAELCYIVTELIRGDTLKAFLEDRGLLPSELVALMGIKIAQGLAFAHAAGVVHRDIKPENVMIREDGVLKLMDFGIARFVEESAITMTGSPIGSPAYMSPEQVLERTPDTRSDIFSLGAMLFKLVTGHLAFPGSNPSVILKKVIEGDHAHILDLQPTVAPILAEIIEQMLSPSPDDRPADAQEIVVRLQQFLEEMAIGENNPNWGLARFTADPADYELRLWEHLNCHLLTHGKEALAAGDHSRARGDFNRLLAIDPDHPDVLNLIADLALLGKTKPLQQSLVRWAGLAVFLVAVPAIWIWARGSQDGLPVLNEDSMPVAIVSEDPGPAAEATEPAKENPAPIVVEALAAPELQTSAPRRNSLTMKEPTPKPTPEGTEDLASLPTASLDPQPAHVGLLHVGLSKSTRGVWADVFVDGQSKGRARGGGTSIQLEIGPGIHVLKVTNDYALAFERRFELEAGQSLRFEDIVLEKRPISVQIQPELAPDCILRLSDQTLGSLGSLGFRSPLANPSDLAKLHIRCPDGTLYGPFDSPSPSPGDIVRFPPQP